jgi:hypothetical protein
MNSRKQKMEENGIKQLEVNVIGYFMRKKLVYTMDFHIIAAAAAQRIYKGVVIDSTLTS